MGLAAAPTPNVLVRSASVVTGLGPNREFEHAMVMKFIIFSAFRADIKGYTGTKGLKGATETCLSSGTGVAIPMNPSRLAFTATAHPLWVRGRSVAICVLSLTLARLRTRTTWIGTFVVSQVRAVWTRGGP